MDENNCSTQRDPNVGMGRVTNCNVPFQIADLARALTEQRQYTLALYAELPVSFWVPAQFPFSAIVNPPLWELAHIAYFAEFFCLRWSAGDPRGNQTRSVMPGADSLFDSARVPHKQRWANQYPSKALCFEYMEAVHALVLKALRTSDTRQRHLFQLALMHEDMHGEALAMTLCQLGLPLPKIVQPRQKRRYRPALPDALQFSGGAIMLGRCEPSRSVGFDNELTTLEVNVAPFAIDALPVSAVAFAAWRDGVPDDKAGLDDFAAIHISHDQAEAYAHAQGRRLPTEAEWEFAATTSVHFWQSSGDVWEWTSSVFTPRPGFVAGPYAEYSVPWFHPPGDLHRVLKGGSFATHPRLKYQQYRNFFTPDRSDMFCGFRTCAN